MSLIWTSRPLRPIIKRKSARIRPVTKLFFWFFTFVETFDIGNLHITVGKLGSRSYSKVSYPLRYGRLGELKTPEHLFEFNLNGELKFITGRGKEWPNPSEWLKRTVTGNWVYYSTGGYDGPYDCLGEYYLPCFSYPSNNINSCDPFEDHAVASAIEAWGSVHEELTKLDPKLLPENIAKFLSRLIANPPGQLRRKAARIREIIGDSVTVLPPDTRHVDYDIVPLIIADGCLYKCAFCKVKSRLRFKDRTKENIKTQIEGLRDFFGKDISNYNSVFLGQHDAMNSDPELIEYSAKLAFEAFDFKNSNLKDPSLFIFGSVASILKAGPETFDRIGRLPFRTYINVGLESGERDTLAKLGKGITVEGVEAAYDKIVAINKRYERIEITSNFIYSPDLPPAHTESIVKLIGKHFDHPYPKGTIYFSPLLDAGRNGWRKNIKREFYKLKRKIPVPSFLYLIQRL